LIQEKHYFSENINFAKILRSLTNIHIKLDKPTKAKESLEKLLLFYEKRYVHGHPDTAKTLFDLSLLYGPEGNFSKAKGLLERGLEILINHPDYGEQHHETLKFKEGLDIIYRYLEQTNSQEHLDMPLRLAIFDPHYGQSHPETAMTLYNLGVAY